MAKARKIDDLLVLESEMTKDQEDAIRLAKDACDHALSMCSHDHTNEEEACWHLLNKALTEADREYFKALFPSVGYEIV